MTSTRTTRLTRTTLAAIAAGGLLTAGGLGAALAPAHTPAGSASCSVITGRMTNAPEDFTSTITLYVDGGMVGSETAKGNHSISREVPQDYDEHTWKVVVDAGQYSGRESGSFGPCKTKPTEPPVTHTPEPTPTEPTHTPKPTPTEPEDTPSPSHTPTPPASTATPAPPTSPAPTTPGSATPSSTPTPDIGTPTSSTNPPTSTPSTPHGSTPATPSKPPTTPSEPSTPHVSKPPASHGAPHCKITDTDRNADCQPDIGGPDSDVVEEGF